MRAAVTVWILFCFTSLLLAGSEPIEPIPRHLDYDPQKAELGFLLFLDPKLSEDGSTACVSCHSFDHGGADPRPVSIGVHGKKGAANAPTVYNAYFNFRQFWNGRAKNLKEQADGPIHNPVEMAMNDKKITAYLRSNPLYAKTFRHIYHQEARFEDLLDAIAEFEKALYTPDCKFDRYLRHETKLTPLQQKGYRLFKRLGCITCHNGINIGGNSYQKMGLIIPYPWSPSDPDRYAVTRNPSDKNIYKVPTLRNIVLTAPYFHDGRTATLEEALKKMAYHNLGFDLNEEETEALIAFLKTLTGKKPTILKKHGY